MAFDVRVGLYDDPPNKDTVKMVQSTMDSFALMGKLSRGWESLFWRFFTTPTYRKFCEATDTSFAMSQKIVDNKVAELNKMAEEGGRFDDNQSECNLMNSTVFLSPLAMHGWWECGRGICPVVPSLVVGLKLFADHEQYIYVIDQGLYCEQSLFSQSSLSSAGLERAKWPRETGERPFLPSPSFPLASCFPVSLASRDFLAHVTILRDCSQSNQGWDQDADGWILAKFFFTFLLKTPKNEASIS